MISDVSIRVTLLRLIQSTLWVYGQLKTGRVEKGADGLNFKACFCDHFLSNLWSYKRRTCNYRGGKTEISYGSEWERLNTFLLISELWFLCDVTVYSCALGKLRFSQSICFSSNMFEENKCSKIIDEDMWCF